MRVVDRHRQAVGEGGEGRRHQDEKRRRGRRRAWRSIPVSAITEREVSAISRSTSAQEVNKPSKAAKFGKRRVRRPVLASIAFGRGIDPPCLLPTSRIIRLQSPIALLHQASMHKCGTASDDVRVTVGCLIAFTIYHLFNLPQGYWAVFTVVIVMQGSIGGTLIRLYRPDEGHAAGCRGRSGVAAWLSVRIAPLGFGVALGSLGGGHRPRGGAAADLEGGASDGGDHADQPLRWACNPLESRAACVWWRLRFGSVIGVSDRRSSVFPGPLHGPRCGPAEKACAALDEIAAIADHYAGDIAVESDEARPDRYP